MESASLRALLLATLGLAACAATELSAPAPREPPPLRPAAPTPISVPSPALTSAAPEPPAPPVPDPGGANLDPDDDDTVGPPDAIADCEQRLAAAGVRFRPGRIPVQPQAGGYVCGTPQAVIYERGPTGVRYNAEPAVSCALALGLARFETIVAEEAERTLGTGVQRIIHGGTYSCRKMARFRMVSEHSYANAIDIRGFVLKDGRTLSVKRHFGKTNAEPSTPEARFLRTVARRAYVEDVFSVALTPFWDALHADHFHFDQARYRVNATGPR